jgi:hypothetical protein
MAIDKSEIQRIKNGIQEGELILRAKKTHGRKLSKAEIEGLQAHLKRQKEKLNTMAKSKKKAPAKRSAEDAKKIKSLRSQAAKLGQKLVAKKSSGKSPIKYSKANSSKRGLYCYKYIGGKK